MAKKEKSIINSPDFFMKVGMAEGSQVGSGVDYGAIGTAIEKGFGAVDKQLKLNKLNQEIELNKGNKAREALMAKFPNGVEIEKAGKEWGSMPVDFLRAQREEYSRYTAIIAQGKDTPGYDDAVTKSNAILGDIEDMSNQFELVAAARQSAMNMEDADGNSLLSESSTAWDQMNINNITTMNTEALQPRIEYIDGRSVLVLKDAQGNDVNAEDFGQKIGKEYSFDLRDKINEAKKTVEDLGLAMGKVGTGSYNRKAAIRDIQKMARDKNAVVDLIFQEDLIDDYIKHWSTKQPSATGLQNLSDEEIYYLRDEFKDPEHKEAIVEWFIDNEITSLDETFTNSMASGKEQAKGSFDGNDY